MRGETIRAIAEETKIPARRLQALVAKQPWHIADREHLTKRTEIDRARVAQRYQQGASVTELSLEFSVSRKTLTRLLASTGIEIRKSSSYTRADVSADELASLYLAGASESEMRAKLNCSARTILRRAKEYGIPLRSRGARTGKANQRWKGGRFVSSSGYVFIRTGETADGRGIYRQEHRVVMESIVGRPLRPEEVVHHKDGDPSNNKPDNLQLFSSNAEHVRVAHPERARRRK